MPAPLSLSLCDIIFSAVRTLKLNCKWKRGLVSFVNTYGADMLGNRCKSGALLLGIFLLATEVKPLQPRVVAEDYDNYRYQNGYRDYQNGNGGYQHGYNEYQNSNDGYQNSNNGYQNSNDGYLNGNDGYQNGYGEYQNEHNRYQNYEPPVKFDRPIVVKPVEKPKNQQDFSKIPGVAGVDYPLYHTVPPTGFSCAHVPFVPGMYANVETGCQAYHICHDGREGHQGASFLCTNGTLFNQREFACDWWYNVNCAEAPVQYRLNLDPEKNPYIPKKPKKERQDGLRIAVY